MISLKIETPDQALLRFKRESNRLAANGKSAADFVLLHKDDPHGAAIARFGSNSDRDLGLLMKRGPTRRVTLQLGAKRLDLLKY